ncbi:MAG: FAD-dependent oxidoreductase [Deltaproteobacteria bacterium]|nr:FAD-dependent oxidoreductase [Deltaproteobacteria bacterium]
MTKENPKWHAAPCQLACPAGIDVPSYVALIGQGRYREAVDLIRKDNPFPWVCGLVCTHKCEQACIRGYQDKPIAIMALKGFAAAQVEAMKDETVYRAPDRVLEKVAVIGAGPSGLTVAYYLTRKGYQVTVFEALPVPGGMMWAGIPEYRLPRHVIRREVERIEKMGVEIRYNSPIGGDYTLDHLRQEGFKAFFMGIGAHRAHKLNIPGEDDYPQAWDAVTFLNRQYLGEKEKAGDRVAVIGGGNAAMDTARISVRLGSRDVDIVYRRTREEMPALKEEIEEAEEEGVRLHFLTIPVRILGKKGKLTGIECLKAELGEPDASGRRRPIPIRGSDFVIEADAVISAIGQMPDLSWPDATNQFDVSRWSTLVVDPHSMQTSVPDVFAGGDAVTGPATVVEAIGAGKRAAKGIDAYLRGEPLPESTPDPLPRMQVEPILMDATDKARILPQDEPVLSMAERKTTFKPVHLGFDEETARQEARRCLRCDLCVGCGDCATVCLTHMGIGALQLMGAGDDRMALTDLLRPAEHCIGCGSCANVCEQGCIEIVDEGDERRLIQCGTVLARLKLAQCESCGTYYAPIKYIEHIDETADANQSAKLKRTLCPECAREIKAISAAGHSAMFRSAQ